MTLYELGEEYTQQSAQIRAQILKLRPQLKTLQGDAYLQLKKSYFKNCMRLQENAGKPASI